MTIRNNTAAVELAHTYAKFFVADFAQNVMGHLRGSHKIPQEVLQGIIDRKLEALEAPGALSITHTSAPGRFVYECAEYALENFAEDLDTRATWDQIKSLPSVHHRENNVIAYATADLLKTTVDNTVVNTIARDADTTAKLITQSARTRINDTETGGSVNMFNWGILQDGLWLNGALLRAADRAHIFKPDQHPTVAWTQQAFNLAHQKAYFGSLTAEDRMSANAEVNLLMADVPAETLNELLVAFDQDKLNDLLFTAGSMSRSVREWDDHRSNPNNLINSITEMSAAARLLQHLQAAAIGQSDDTAVSDLVRDRLESAYESVTMALVGYEVLRETSFANTLIMSVKGEGNDPKVDVFVNADTLNTYHANRGDDEDLIRFGLHLDPRRGMPVSSNGWSIEFILNARDTVIPNIIAEESERLEKMRMNDAAVIREQTTQITSDMVQSYLNARQIEEMPIDLRQSISRFSQSLSHGTESLQMDNELVSLLAKAHGDPFVQMATSLFVANLGDDKLASFAPAATVASLALEEAIDFFVGFGAPSA